MEAEARHFFAREWERNLARFLLASLSAYISQCAPSFTHNLPDPLSSAHVT